MGKNLKNVKKKQTKKTTKKTKNKKKPHKINECTRMHELPDFKEVEMTQPPH